MAPQLHFASRRTTWSGDVACETTRLAMQDITEHGTILSIRAHLDQKAYRCPRIMAIAGAIGGADLLCELRPDTALTFPVRGPEPSQDIAVHHWTVDAVRRIG